MKQKFKGFNVEFIDPRDVNKEATGVFVREELEACKRCDAIFTYISPEDVSGIGTMAEMTTAFHLGKPIFLVHEGVMPHPFMLYMSHVYRATLESGLASFESYLIGDESYIYAK